MELMTIIIVFIGGVFGLLTSFWWMLLPIGVAFSPDGRHVKWLVAAGFVFYGALMIYGVFGETIMASSEARPVPLRSIAMICFRFLLGSYQIRFI